MGTKRNGSDKNPVHNEDGPSDITRRSFLKGAGVGTAGLTALNFSLPGVKAEDKPRVPPFPPLLGPSPVPVTLEVNGQTYTVNVEPRMTLADVLRAHLDLTGTKVICDRGACGGCTVLLDNEPVVSCMLLAITAQGKAIRTVEGLAQGTKQLDPLQDAFIMHDAVQCGFCTPGMLMSCRALLDRMDRTRKPTLAEIKTAVSGNLCRCGTYPHVFAAVLAASGQELDLAKG